MRAPDLTLSAEEAAAASQFSGQELPEGLPESFSDPKMMQQAAQALSRLPKGQMQRLQAVMQKAMSGKDVTKEAAELENSLPADFKSLIQGFQSAQEGSQAGINPGLPGLGAMQGLEGSLDSDFDVSSDSVVGESMTEEQARQLVEQAMRDGTIDQSQALDLLENTKSTGESKTQTSGGITDFWKKLKRKKA